MSLTSRDETDLLLPLYAGIGENPPFATFLERMRRRTGADYVSIAIRRGDRPMAHATQFFAGRDIQRLAREVGSPELMMLDRIQYDRLRPGRVYAMAEFSDHHPGLRAEHERHLRALGIADQRVLRLLAEDGLDAWLILARATACSAADSALLSNLAPYLREALRALIRLELREIEVAMGAEGLSRSGAGWLLFDRDARLVAIDRATEAAFARLALPVPRPGERLRDLPPGVERMLISAAAEFSGTPDGPPRAVVLSERPRIEALLSAPQTLPVVSLVAPAMLALCRLPRAAGPGRAIQFAALHALPRREAELAVALSDGQSIAEAAATMGLTLETTRNYSKRLYAQLGVRGQAELVGLVHAGGASFA